MTSMSTTDTTITNTIIEQIGRMNVLAISGGRVAHKDDAVWLPVSNGYSVEVALDRASDTYTVRRWFIRGGRSFLKGERTYVYCDEVGEVAYRAGMFRSFAPEEF